MRLLSLDQAIGLDANHGNAINFKAKAAAPVFRNWWKDCTVKCPASIMEILYLSNPSEDLASVL